MGLIVVVDMDLGPLPSLAVALFVLLAAAAWTGIVATDLGLGAKDRLLLQKDIWIVLAVSAVVVVMVTVRTVNMLRCGGAGLSYSGFRGALWGLL
jgi:hypothetical protein